MTKDFVSQEAHGYKIWGEVSIFSSGLNGVYYGMRVKSDIIDASQLNAMRETKVPGLFETLKRHGQMTIAETIEVV